GRQACGLVPSVHQVETLDGSTCGALGEIVDRGGGDDHPVVHGYLQVNHIGSSDVASLWLLAFRQEMQERLVCAEVLVGASDVGGATAGRCGDGGEDAAHERCKDGGEGDVDVVPLVAARDELEEVLLDLRGVPVGHDAVGAEVLHGL